MDPREKGEILSSMMLASACGITVLRTLDYIIYLQKQSFLMQVMGEEEQTSKTYKPGKLGLKKYF